MSLRVLHPGLFTTVQDLGRPGHQREGVPEGGAMDPVALRIANLLVGNEEGAAALEMTLTGPTLVLEEDALVALAGGDLRATVVGEPLPLWRPIRLAAGSEITVGVARAGCRGYLAVSGGISVPLVLGSRSTLVRAELGGIEGRVLRRGDLLPCGAPSGLAVRIARSIAAMPPAERAPTGSRREATARVAHWGAGPSLRPAYSDHPVVRLLPGAHEPALSAGSREQLLHAEFRLASQSDRMGFRLVGPPLELAAPTELLSEAVAFGTVQLPPGGQPIILMADRQTTGGYPRIGEVATVDLPLVAQLKPGDHLRFAPISLDEAQALYLAREREMAEAREGIALRHR